jgi:sugar phosphate isomerase/epimerase
MDILIRREERNVITRRTFNRLVSTGVPAAWAALGPQPACGSVNSNFNGVQIGTITYSFKQDLRNPDEIIPDLVSLGIGSVELMSDDAERMADAPPIPNFGFGVKLTTEQQAAVNEGKRQRKAWRAKATPATFQRVRQMFDQAGIRLQILCYNMPADIEDDEIEHAFRMARAFDVAAISPTSTVKVARRVAPVADKRQIIWGGHNHAEVNNPNEFASIQSLELVVSLSRFFGVNLDIGHFTAGNRDAMAFIQKYHDRITNLHLKDRKRNNGPNVPWGQGDTPIREILLLMHNGKYKFPANIELEYPIPQASNSVAEIRSVSNMPRLASKRNGNSQTGVAPFLCFARRPAPTANSGGFAR